ncbi:MAG TPA: hypothetical protein VK901_20450 [Nitrospiraceae bacterium]|nr:hypothetical protein [Nitrospiraceae bacterium]
MMTAPTLSPTSDETTIIRNMPIRQRIDWLTDYAHRHSVEFQSSESYQARSFYIAQHPTAVVALSCMDGRINISVATDTPAGIFRPLTFILARDPETTVVIYPSGHSISPEDSFLSAVNQAVRGSNSLGGRPVLLAAKPDPLELEYGWSKLGRVLGRVGTAAIHAVQAFFEKPDEGTVREARATGILWNTMVLAAREESSGD